MTDTKQSPTKQSPFELSPTEYPFRDAIVIQTVPLPTMLQWEHETGGFFVETEEKPSFGEFIAATLVVPSGKRVQGYAAKQIEVFPIAIRFLGWFKGSGSSEARIPEYVDNAHSKSNMLAIAMGGQFVLLAAKGMASQTLLKAFAEHKKKTRYRFKAKPFVLAMSCMAGGVKEIKGSFVTEFTFVAGINRCSDDLGWAVVDRDEEVRAWGGGGSNNQAPATATVPALVEQVASDTLVYIDSMSVDPQNDKEVEAFKSYQLAHRGQAPMSRVALKGWNQPVVTVGGATTQMAQ